VGVGLLTALSFGLDLAACAATGVLEDLTYVSPKSGRAVSREAGRDVAFCAHALNQPDDFYAVPNADADVRFRDLMSTDNGYIRPEEEHGL